MNVLEVQDLSYSYNRSQRALDGVSLTIESESIIGLIGPNGSGKSTLIKNVCDLLSLQDGDLRICGASHSSPAAKRNTLYLASNDYLPEFLTGYEFIALMARLYGVSPSRDEVGAVFRTLSMEGRHEDLVGDYSHRMRKKTQVASAILLRRPLTIIDETLNGIDLEALYLTDRELLRLREDGKSVLLCTHDFRLIERLADRVMFLDLGKLIVDERTDAVIERHGSVEAMVLSHLGTER